MPQHEDARIYSLRGDTETEPEITGSKFPLAAALGVKAVRKVKKPTNQDRIRLLGFIQDRL